MVFPFIDAKRGSVLKQAGAFLKHLTGHSSKPEGFIEKGSSIYVFYDISATSNYKIGRIKLKTEKIFAKTD